VTKRAPYITKRDRKEVEDFKQFLNDPREPEVKYAEIYNKVPANLAALGVREWPHQDCDGVGLQFEGTVDDPVLFTSVLASYGCHPKAAARILARLAAHGITQVTITRTVPSTVLREELKTLGVHMTVIPPQPNWAPTYDDGAWPEDSLFNTNGIRGAPC
jgi:hypothetical protein